MTKIIPFRRPTRTSAHPPSWHRSFPQYPAAGTEWTLTVIDDLIAFSNDRDLTEVARELQATRDRIAPYLEPDQDSLP